MNMAHINKEVAQRIKNTLQKRIKRETNITIENIEFDKEALKPGYQHTAQWHFKIEVSGNPTKDWHSIYDFINDQEYLYNKHAYKTRTESNSNGAKGKIYVRIENVKLIN